ncbi:MAG: S8 family serine peptidase [Bacillota bacterium]
MRKAGKVETFLVLLALLLQVIGLFAPISAGASTVLQPLLWLDEMNVPAFRQATGATGSGILIAVVDTGVDPTLPSLHGSDRSKILEWVDFSGEGRVALRDVEEVRGDAVFIEGRWVRLGAIRSRSGQYKYGWLEERQLPAGAANGRDLDGNGKPNDAFLVLVVDSSTAGHYETVYIDRNRNFDLSDDRGISVYRHYRESVVLQSPGGRKGTGVVVAGLDPAGNEVSIGFDGHGHGTQMASIAAAEGVLVGHGMSGTAPGAKIMALKAFGSDGQGTWKAIVSAVEYAGSAGAHIVLISAAGSGTQARRELEAIHAAAQRYGMLVVLAAGNDGPGLDTMTLGSPGRNVLIVGGLVSPGMWQYHFGVSVQHPTVAVYSSVGGIYGSPSLVAPAMAVALLPSWRSETVALVEGTSVAAAKVAGGVALLWQAAYTARLGTGERDLARSVRATSRALTAFSPLERGYGQIDLLGAWNHLRSELSTPDLHSQVILGDEIHEETVVLDAPLGEVEWLLTNQGLNSADLRVLSNTAWARPLVSSTTVQPGTSRRIRVALTPPQEVGVHHARLDAVTPDGRVAASAFIVVIIPYGRISGGTRVSLTKRVEPGMLARFHVAVGKGVTDLDGTIAALGHDAYSGDVYLFEPGGRLHSVGPLSGGLVLQIDDPVPGIWEAVVDLSANSRPQVVQLDVRVSGYRVEPYLSGFSVEGSRVSASARLHYFGPGRDVSFQVVRDLVPPSASEQMLILYQGYARFQAVTPVPFGVSALEVIVDQPSVTGTELALYLYYYDPSIKRYRQVGSSAISGRSTQRVEVVHPSPGAYVAYVETPGILGASKITVRYRERITVNAGVSLAPTATRLVGNEIIELALSELPLYSDDLRLAVRPSESDVPVVYLSLPRVDYPLRPELVPGGAVAGSHGNVSVHFVSENLRRVESPAYVNGIKYLPRSGVVSAPVPFAGQSASVSVSVDASDQGVFVEEQPQVMVAPLGSRHGSSIVGGDGDRYQKLMTLLRDQ